MASVLMEYEMLYHRSWCRAVDTVKSGMHAALLVKHPETKELFVNLDPAILELIQEAKYIQKLSLEVPATAASLCLQEAKLIDTRSR